MFVPWINREKVGLVSDQSNNLEFVSTDVLEKEYESFRKASKQHSDLLKKYERLYGASFRQLKVAMHLASVAKER